MKNPKPFAGSQLTVHNSKNNCKNIGAIRWKHAAHAWTRHSGPTSLHGSLPAQQDATETPSGKSFFSARFPAILKLRVKPRQTAKRSAFQRPEEVLSPANVAYCSDVVAPSQASKRSVLTVWVIPATSNLPNSLICRVCCDGTTWRSDVSSS